MFQALIAVLIGSISLTAFAGPEAFPVYAEARKHLANIQSASYDAKTCAVYLSDLQNQVSGIRWNDYTHKMIKDNAVPTMRLFWDLRLAIHQRLPLVGEGCVMQVREIFPQLREAEDYLSEFAYPLPVRHPERIDFQTQAVPIYERDQYFPYFARKDVDQGVFKFKSGDVMLSRGVSFISAVISRISNNRSQFSHAVMWNMEGGPSAGITIEAYAGMGTRIFADTFALKNENVRLMVLRPKNAVLGRKAAERALEFAEQETPYDYYMDFRSPRAMTCVEVAVHAYSQASEGKVQLPSYPSQVQLRAHDFLRKMNLRPGPLVTPADLETDPNFELLLEWRDYRLIRDSRYKDAILSEVIRWMDELDYKFHETTRSFLAKYMVHPSRSTVLWPLIQQITGVPEIDTDIPQKTIGVLTVLNDISTVLLEELRLQEEAHIRVYGRPRTNKELRAALEKFRQEDVARRSKSGKSRIHRSFHP